MNREVSPNESSQRSVGRSNVPLLLLSQWKCVILLLVSQMTDPREEHEAKEGCPARDAGPDGAEDSRCARAVAWARHRAADRTDQRRTAGREPGHPLSRTPEAGTGGSCCFGVGTLREQPQGPLLSADPCGPQTAGSRKAGLGADRCDHCAVL